MVNVSIVVDPIGTKVRECTIKSDKTIQSNSVIIVCGVYSYYKRQHVYRFNIGASVGYNIGKGRKRVRKKARQKCDLHTTQNK